MTAAAILDHTLTASGKGSFAEAAARGVVECGAGFRQEHFLEGFPNRTGRFRFRPDWAALGPFHAGLPAMPDYAATIEAADAEHPFRMLAPPARSFLNSSFTETPSSRAREVRPSVLVHVDDADRLGLVEGALVRIGNRRGEMRLHARRSTGMRPGILVVEGIWRSGDHVDGLGVNQLIGADPVAPAGGVAFHDTAVWLRPTN